LTLGGVFLGKRSPELIRAGMEIFWLIFFSPVLFISPVNTQRRVPPTCNPNGRKYPGHVWFLRLSPTKTFSPFRSIRDASFYACLSPWAILYCNRLFVFEISLPWILKSYGNSQCMGASCSFPFSYLSIFPMNVAFSFLVFFKCFVFFVTLSRTLALEMYPPLQHHPPPAFAPDCFFVFFFFFFFFFFVFFCYLDSKASTPKFLDINFIPVNNPRSSRCIGPPGGIPCFGRNSKSICPFLIS